MNTIEVSTNFSPDLIESVVAYEVEGIREKVQHSVIKLQDEGIRQALINMGWTPPGEVNYGQCECGKKLTLDEHYYYGHACEQCETNQLEGFGG